MGLRRGASVTAFRRWRPATRLGSPLRRGLPPLQSWSDVLTFPQRGWRGLLFPATIMDSLHSQHSNLCPVKTGGVRMRRRSTGIAAIIIATVFAIGCGETFRPIATPIPEPGGDPANLRHAIVVNENGGSQGSASNIDTTGDTNVGNTTVGVGPVHAGFVSSSRTYVA